MPSCHTRGFSIARNAPSPCRSPAAAQSIISARSLLDEPVAFRGGEPLGFRRRIRQIGEEHDAENHGRKTLRQKQPLPAGEAHPPLQIEQRARQATHEHGTERQRHVKSADRPRAHIGRKPLAQIENHSGEEARLRHAQQKTHHVKFPRRLHQHHAHRQKTPGEHDSRDPTPRAEPVQQQVRGYLASRIAQKEKPRAQPIARSAEMQIAIHLQRGKADVHAIRIRNAVRNGDERNEAHAGFAQRGSADRVVPLSTEEDASARFRGGVGGGTGSTTLIVALHGLSIRVAQPLLAVRFSQSPPNRERPCTPQNHTAKSGCATETASPTRQSLFGERITRGAAKAERSS